MKKEEFIRISYCAFVDAERIKQNAKKRNIQKEESVGRYGEEIEREKEKENFMKISFDEPCNQLAQQINP